MTKDWLIRQFRNNKNLNKSLRTYISKASDVYFSSSSSQEHDAANEIFKKIQTVDDSRLSMQSKTFLLLSSFFEKLLITKEIIPQQVAYFQKIRQAQILLNTDLTTVRPSLRSIAKQTGLSEAVLKRHFKIIYGSSIQEYYLQQKMELARRILIEKNMNVNEVANHLGFANVSSFIEVFKKHFGYQPELARKSQ